MKHLFRFSLLSCVLIFSSLQASWRVMDRDGLPVILSVCEGDLVREKAVFKAAFATAYQGTEIERAVQQKYGGLECFLDVAFEDEDYDFMAKKPDSLFISAKNKEGDVIGFVAFDKNSGSSVESSYVYVRQLAIHPEYQHKHLGLFLTFSFLTAWPDYRSVKLLTRRLNSSAVGFYTKLGFRESLYTHEGYDSRVYIGLEHVFDEAFARAMCECYIPCD